jgi:hypothetical protein
MPETTNNDAPGADRPTARPDQEGPGRAGGAARPPSELAAEPEAREAVRSVTEDAKGKPPSEAGSPTDTAP